MKTLEEVIKAIEYCEIKKDDCFTCPYKSDSNCYALDALHYLKEYQEHMKWHAYEEHCLDNEKKTLQEKKAEFDEILTDYVALKQWWTEQQENPPLTWEELKTVLGKPVWVEEYDPIDDNKGWHRCKWYLVNFVNDEYFYVCDNDGEENHFCLAEIGKTWTAYRKERKATGGNLIPEPKSKKIGDYTEIKWREK